MFVKPYCPDGLPVGMFPFIFSFSASAPVDQEFSMSEQKSPAPKTGVSPARTIVSLVALLIVGVICVIELRAGFGQMLSAKALKAELKEGVEFHNLPLQKAQGMLVMFPSETVEERGLDRSFRYEWYSLLRPLMGQKNPSLTIIAGLGDNAEALTFFAGDEDELVMQQAPSGESLPMPMSGGGAGGMGMDETGAGRGGDGGGSRRPAIEEVPSADDANPQENSATPAAPENSEDADQ